LRSFFFSFVGRLEDEAAGSPSFLSGSEVLPPVPGTAGGGGGGGAKADALGVAPGGAPPSGGGGGGCGPPLARRAKEGSGTTPRATSPRSSISDIHTRNFKSTAS